MNPASVIHVLAWLVVGIAAVAFFLAAVCCWHAWQEVRDARTRDRRS